MEWKKRKHLGDIFIDFGLLDSDGNPLKYTGMRILDFREFKQISQLTYVKNKFLSLKKFKIFQKKNLT
jgi:hypothetical protein